MPIRSLDGARHLRAIVNSRAVLERVIPMQSRGWHDPRDVDKLVWDLPVPEFDSGFALHQEIAAAGLAARIEALAATLLAG